MLALYIIFGIFTLLFLLLYSSVYVKVLSEDEFTVIINYLFFRFRFPKPKTEGQPKVKKSKVEKKENPIKKLLRQKGLANTVSEVTSLLKIFVSKFSAVLKHVRVRKCTFVAVAASNDPATTGVEYGAVCAVVFPLFSSLQTKMKWNLKKTNVSVKSDFNSDKPILKLDVRVKIKLWFLFTSACAIIFKIVKNKIRQQSEFNTQSHNK